MKDSHTRRYTNVGELTKAIQIKVFGGRGNVTQQGDLGALIKIKFSPPPSSLNLASLSLLHISVCSMFPITFPLSFRPYLHFLTSFSFCFLPSCRSFVHPVPSFRCSCSRPSASVSLSSLLLSFLCGQQYHHKTGSLQQLLSLIKIKTKHYQNVNGTQCLLLAAHCFCSISALGDHSGVEKMKRRNGKMRPGDNRFRWGSDASLGGFLTFLSLAKNDRLTPIMSRTDGARGHLAPR